MTQDHHAASSASAGRADFHTNSTPAEGPDLGLLTTPRVVIPKETNGGGRAWKYLLAVLILSVVPGVLYSRGYRPQKLWAKPAPQLASLEVDKGDVPFFVVESGSLESANNATVKCKVEALMGLVGGTQSTGGQGGTQGASGNRAGGGTTAGSSVTGSAGGTSGSSSKSSSSSTSKSTSTSKSKSSSSSKSASSSISSTSTLTSGTAAGGSGSGAAGGTGTTGGTTQTAAASSTTPVPDIRSFSMTVEPYEPLRGATTAGAAASRKGVVQQAPQQQGGGRGGRGGGGMGDQEKPGSTRILTIMPEGTFVKAGEVVCTLDASSFRDEAAAQKVKYIQAKAYVEQAKSLLEVNQISLREYQDGIYPEDRSLIQQYVATCRIEDDRAQNNLKWSRATHKLGFRARSQVRADELEAQRSSIALHEAQNMEDRLEKYTAPRLIKELQAKVEANRADLFAQEAAFQLESDRLRKLETMVENCTMRAPRDGLVVYVNQANPWGRIEAQIQEGATVREGQPIFELPDPSHMRVKAKINESKVGFVEPGQAAEVRVDAFPDRPLRGTVTEVTAIPAPTNGPGSDVRVYYAMVRIETGGFNELRPGLSAEVSFFVERKQKVTRVPVEAVRWVGDRAFAAVNSATGPQWRPLELGLINASHAEVLSGLKPGERVIRTPDQLPAPAVPLKASRAATAAAGSGGAKRG